MNQEHQTADGDSASQRADLSDRLSIEEILVVLSAVSHANEAGRSAGR